MIIYKLDTEVKLCFCHASKADVIHLCWQYTHTKKLWSDFLMFIQSHFVRDFSFCFKDVFFGLFDNSKENIGKYNFIKTC